MPESVTFSVSNDGKHFHPIGTIKNILSEQKDGTILKDFTLHLSHPFSTRYVRVYAKSLKQCPKWHKGYPYKAWIFTDEITIK
jgi:hypothetical protein